MTNIRSRTHQEATRAGRDPLTARQQEIWQFLVEYVDGHGYPPTVREIGEEVGLASPSTVHAHLANLERVGLIRRDPTKPRAIELTGHRRVEAPAASDVPRCRSSAAWQRAAAARGGERGGRRSGARGDRPGADFLLTIHGDSMIEAGISTGTRSSCSAAPTLGRRRRRRLVGDDESADEATVKTFHREADGRIRLQPENAALEPIYADHVEILGKVGVFRSLR